METKLKWHKFDAKNPEYPLGRKCLCLNDAHLLNVNVVFCSGQDEWLPWEGAPIPDECVLAWAEIRPLEIAESLGIDCDYSGWR